MVWSAAALALIPIGLSALRSAPPTTTGDPAGVDTFIPRGFVLVPIEAENYEALDSILGPFGWVDLFQGGGDGGERHLVAQNVRLLRAPNNPSHFAVLIPERRAPQILKAGGSFVVVVKRPGQDGTVFVDSPVRAGKPARRRITYDDR